MTNSPVDNNNTIVIDAGQREWRLEFVSNKLDFSPLFWNTSYNKKQSNHNFGIYNWRQKCQTKNLNGVF
jgi:hypothetical protein